MAWNFFCADENMTLTANSKEELAQKVMQHMEDMHDTQMSWQQAMEMVNQDAKQTAA